VQYYKIVAVVVTSSLES